MLKVEPKYYYEVYPSWADLSYRWEELPTLLADPENSSYFQEDPNKMRTNWEALGYPEKGQRFELIDGPAGGGIVRAHLELVQTEYGMVTRWKAGLILCSEASVSGCPGTYLYRVRGSLKDGLFDHVHHLEPSDEPG